MENTVFQKLYSQLNPEQKEAVDILEGPVMVVAGPGTGKTKVLTLRIANILLQGKARPEEILALTFTENAAANMRRRLFEILGASAYAVNISTFHGFCNEIIRQNPDSFLVEGGTKTKSAYGEGGNIPEVDQAQILEEIIKSGNFEHFNLQNPYVNYIAIIKKAISDLKREGVSHDEYAAIVGKAEEELAGREDLYHTKGPHKGKMKGEYQEARKRIEKNKEFCEVYQRYRGKLSEAGDYDYEDMILYVTRALRHDTDLRRRLCENFKYILIDEHQDTNSAQNEVVERIVQKEAPPRQGSGQANIFVVGDEKQAIFRFQGASLANILHFKDKFPASKIITLQKNYRSHQKIIDSSQSVIRNNRERIVNYIKGIDDSLVAAGLRLAEVAPATQAGLRLERQVEIYEPETPELEAYFIKEKIKELQAEGISANEIAVLYRENREGDSISDALSKEGIVHTIESSRS
ncbi:MAG: UvrD-helicase domain-containing protein, partial [Candidatus Sungbacteria bacterium]|nr:UvrD-helicase domain-containing protein [Candidatus Sungbacteria bacterium]